MRSMCVAIAGCGGYSNEMKSGMIDYVLGVQTTKLMNFMAAGPRQCGAKREWPERTTIRFSALSAICFESFMKHDIALRKVPVK